eukprot:TRINITY_DN911_c4_g1_i1.p2 TRINITY_DN911_c4_g1~~TRINITY_DN911_c4_g1_i1.p2  ORF type:complete len:372 (+),score=79.29 TRINITY_DN911_c4_g1_i1:2163-3278(+)
MSSPPTTPTKEVVDHYSDRSNVSEILSLLKTQAGRQHMTRSSLRVLEEEVADVEQAERADIDEYQKLVTEIEALKIENERLRSDRLDDENKVKALSRIAGPLIENAVYLGGASPPPPRNSMSLKAGLKPVHVNNEVQPIIIPRIRDRALEDKISQQDSDISTLLYKLKMQRTQHHTTIDNMQTADVDARTKLDNQLSGLVREQNECVKLLYSLGKKYSQSRIDGLEKECSQANRLRELEDLIAKTEEDISSERKQRAHDLTMIIRKAQGTKKHQLLKIRAEQKQKTTELAALRETAAKQRQTDDKRIDHLTSKLTTLTRQCQRLSKAKSYEMQGLASEVSIVKNNLKMLECFIDCGAAIDDLHFIEEVQAP